jgi:hypothetical protein
MEYLTDFLQILVPAGLVLYAVYLIVRNFLQKDFDKKLVELKINNSNTVLPIRLQAYERICLLLERISPNNMLLRLSDPAFNALQFQQLVLKEVREEFNHNLSQQVYMSEEVWEKVRATVNEIIGVINQAGEGMTAEQNSVDLSQRIFDQMIQLDRDPIGEALAMTKKEIQTLF